MYGKEMLKWSNVFCRINRTVKLHKSLLAVSCKRLYSLLKAERKRLFIQVQYIT
ncbi:hypothetical protein FLA_1016 [Filimonas lacunae]|nr:hypothetical protein FLA_1016 [Filimonas lacunae]